MSEELARSAPPSPVRREPAATSAALQLAYRARDIARELSGARAALDASERLVAGGSVVVDLQGHVLHFSSGAHRLAGLDAAVERLSLRRWLRLVHPDDRRQVSDVFRQLFSGLFELYRDYGCTHRLLRADGGTLDVELTLSAVPGPEATVDHVVVSFRDITAAKAEARAHAGVVDELEARITHLEQQNSVLLEARRAAMRTEAAHSAMLAALDGGVRTPLSSMAGYLRMLADGEVAEPDAGLLAEALASGDSLRATLDDVLDLTRLERGTLALEASAFAPRALLEELASRWRSWCERDGLRLELDLPAKLPARVQGDRGRIARIVEHFLANAARHTEQGGIVLRCRAGELLDDGRVPLRIEVEDTGIGIAEDRRIAFERSWRLDGGTRPGLGLPLSAALARRMGGRIGYRHAEYRGACFSLELPLAPPAAEADGVAADATPLRERLGRPPRVLLAEDVPLNRMIARHIVEGLGCIVDDVCDGVEAVAAIDARAYDLVLMDVAMPRMDGISATRRIRARADERAAVPIVAVTAYVLKEDVDRLREAGADLCVAKPLDRHELRAAMEQLLAAAPAPIASPQMPAAPVGADKDAQQVIGAAPWLDATVLDDLAAFLPPDRVASMLDALGPALDRVLDAAKRAQSANDTAELAEAVHPLSGSAGSLGVAALTALGKEIERCARTDQGSRAFKLAEALPGVVWTSLAAVAQWRGQSAAMPDPTPELMPEKTQESMPARPDAPLGSAAGARPR